MAETVICRYCGDWFHPEQLAAAPVGDTEAKERRL